MLRKKFCAANVLIIRLTPCPLYKSLTQGEICRCNFAFVMKKLAALGAACLLSASFLLTSCEKEEKAIVLPPAGPAAPGSVTMGEEYEDQVFYDFETNKVVSTSGTTSWDLAFEASPEGWHLFMNGGKGVFLYNTHKTAFSDLKEPPAGMNTSTLLFDDPSGRPDSTAARDWRDANGQSRHEVYIAKLDDTTYYKFIVLSVDSGRYELQYGRVGDAAPVSLTIPKDAAYNYAYFSFSKGLVNPEPPKAAWDVVFTRYRYIYRDLNNFPYQVNGVLLNPAGVSAVADSTQSFDEINFEKTSQLPLTTDRDAIGFDWKSYNFTTARYEVNKKKCYILHTRSGKVYKLHFLDFYNATGVKGSPSFESLQIQ